MTRILTVLVAVLVCGMGVYAQTTRPSPLPPNTFYLMPYELYKAPIEADAAGHKPRGIDDMGRCGRYVKLEGNAGHPLYQDLATLDIKFGVATSSDGKGFTGVHIASKQRVVVRIFPELQHPTATLLPGRYRGDHDGPWFYLNMNEADYKDATCLVESVKGKPNIKVIRQ